MAEKVTKCILYIIVKDNLPLSITEKDGFKRLMKLVDRDIQSLLIN